jgi:ferredoxin--NADP+ reductase
MSEWLEGRVVENRHWTPHLFSLRVEAPKIAFEAGQFVRIALDIGGERVARPFSFVNPPDDPVQEYYGVVVPDGLLSPRLAELKAGDRLYVADNPSGFLVLSEVPDADCLWLVATGTGLAPFLSVLRSDAPWQRYGRVVLVHAARHANELVYGGLLAEVGAARKGRFACVTMVSRERHAGALQGRIPAAIRDGRLEAAAGAPLAPGSSQVMLCGNPDMVKDAIAALAERGMKKHRRRAPGQITTEAFW